MALSVETAYHVTNGILKGYVLKPHRVSKCGSYGFFYDPMEPVRDKEIRIHSKHLSTREPERVIAKVQGEEKERMAALHATAHSFVSSENLVRIENLQQDLESRIETNMAEVHALRQGTRIGETPLWTPERIIMVVAILVAILALVL